MRVKRQQLQDQQLLQEQRQKLQEQWQQQQQQSPPSPTPQSQPPTAGMSATDQSPRSPSTAVCENLRLSAAAPVSDPVDWEADIAAAACEHVGHEAVLQG